VSERPHQQASSRAPFGDLTDDDLLLIGKIAVAHGSLEMAALMILTRLARIEIPIGIKLFGGESLRSLLDRAERLLRMPDAARLGDDATQSAIKDWVGTVGQIKGERNRILHAVWLAGVGGPVGITFRGGKASVNVLSTEYLTKTEEALRLLAARGFDLVIAAGALKVDADEALEALEE
jgi:hypothetical protein